MGDSVRGALARLTVLVTRPAHQADDLCALIEDGGGSTIHLPTIEIAPPKNLSPAIAIVNQLEDYQIAIFISTNAVERAMPLIAARGGFPATLTLAAVGKRTATALERFGYRTDVYPPEGGDSEALLSLSALQELKGKRVAIFRGAGGRELLAQVLRERGAKVDYAEVYRRTRPAYALDDRLDAKTKDRIDIIITTSNEGLENLVVMAGNKSRDWLRKQTVLVVSTRGAASARELGFTRTPVISEGASATAIVEALRKWWQRGKPAD